MNINDLKPAHNLAKRYGVKVTLFGGPGAGKTPIAATAPRPVICVAESGMNSMRHSNIPAWEAQNVKTIKEFFDWCTKSNEAKNFDTFIFDSFSQIAQIILADCERRLKHGKQAYGEMAKTVYEYANDLFYLPNKHVIMIAQQCLVENGKQKIIENNQIINEPIMQKRPYFPGQALNVSLPHLFDSTWHLSDIYIHGVGNQKAIRTVETPEIFARDRFCNLNELEPANMTELFRKSLAA